MQFLGIEESLGRELIIKIFEYDPATGNLLWKQRCKHLGEVLNMTDKGLIQFNKRRAGKVAGSINNNGYRQVHVTNKSVKYSGLVHRIVWFMVNGEIPNIIDHINGDRLDNRINNLRNVSMAENALNSKERENSTSGVTGVSYRKQRNKWRAYYFANGKQFTLGHYSTFDEAVKARKDWEISSGNLFRERS